MWQQSNEGLRLTERPGLPGLLVLGRQDPAFPFAGMPYSASSRLAAHGYGGSRKVGVRRCDTASTEPGRKTAVAGARPESLLPESDPLGNRGRVSERKALPFLRPV